MAHRRRRTDALPAAADLPGSSVDRMRAVCTALFLSGFADVLAFRVPVDGNPPDLLAHAGDGGMTVDAAATLAEGAAHGGRPMVLIDGSTLPEAPQHQLAAVVAGEGDDHRTMVVLSDPHLSRREVESVATWLSPSTLAVTGDGVCNALACELAADYSADAVVIALFAESGMLLNLHVRSGGLLRSWRLPIDTVWGEAARHEAAFMLGELHMHPGAESLASLGMKTASIVGITNGRGTAVGAIGIASRGQLDMDSPRALLARASALGIRVMELRGAHLRAPEHDDNGMVELRAFAARVACRRFAMYSVTGNVLRLASAHAEDGSILVAPPDPYEEQLVCWAAEKGIAIVAEDAAAVLVGEDTVLYAQDPRKRPIECLRRALVALRDSPYYEDGEERAA